MRNGLLRLQSITTVQASACLSGILQLPSSTCGPPLRIALFSPELPTIGGSNGIITYCRIMRDALRELGHSVMIVSASHVEQFDGSIAELPRPRAWHRLRSRRYKDNFAAILNAFDAARIHGAQVFEMEESFGWAGRLKGLPVVARLHGPNTFSPDYRDARREAAEFASLCNVDAITSPSTKLLEAIRARYGVSFANATVIPNPMPVASARWNVEFADRDQILFVGRFDRAKGADVAIEAFVRAREQLPNLRLLMIGPGEPFMGIPSGVAVLGALPPERITELRLQSALALSCSRSEAFSYVVAEAMALGMPVLATDTFGPSEIIRDGVDGQLVPVGNVGAAAQAIIAMISNPSKLAEIGDAAASRVRDYMSPARIASESASLYCQLLGFSVDRAQSVAL